MNINPNPHTIRMPGYLRAVLACMLTVTLLASCGGDGDGGGGGADAGTLVIALSEEPPSLDLMYETGTMLGSVFAPNVAPALGELDDSGNVVPLLAESWEQPDPTTGSSSRKDVKFSTGEDLTADDVVASINHGLPESPHADTSYPYQITDVVAVDEFTVEITTDTPSPLLQRSFPFMFVLPADTLPEKGDTVDEFIGAGPYVIDEYIRGDRIIMTPNEEYYGEAPEYDRVEFWFRPDEGVRTSAVASGEADLAFPVSVESESLVPNLIEGPGIEVTSFNFNAVGQNDGSIFEDIRVRKAVNMAVDRQAIIDSLFGGKAVLPKCQINPPYFFGIDPDLEDYPYDPEAARELIKEAGVEGAEFVMYSIIGYYTKGEEVVEIMAESLRDIGLEPKVSRQQLDKYVSEYVALSEGADSPWDMLVAYHDNATLDSSLKTFPNFQSVEAGGTGRYLAHDPEMDAMISAAAEETDVEARETLMQDVWRHQCDEAYTVSIAVANSLYAAGENVDYTPREDHQLRISDISTGD